MAAITRLAGTSIPAGDAVPVCNADGSPIAGGGGGGDASAANQTTEIGHLADIVTAVEGTLDVSGTVTANLGATDNAVLDSILAALGADLNTLIQFLGAGDVPTVPSATDPLPTQIGQLRRDVDAVSAADVTDVVMNGDTALTPKFAVIDHATSGDNTIVAAVTSKKVRVLAAFLISAGTVTARFESGAGGTALTGQMSLIANVGFVLPYSKVGWFETASGVLLNLELSGAVSADGCLVYVEV